MALPPSNTVDIEVFLSGSSSQDNGIARLFADICEAGTLDTFKDFSASGNGKKHTAYLCKVDLTQVIGGFPNFEAANPGPNPRVLLHKRSEGGSGMGVQPVIEEAPITAMQIWNDVTNATNCTLLASPANTYSCTITNAGDTVSVVSDAGVSDVNPEMFVGANAGGFDPVDAAVVAAKMEVRPAAALVFGIPVTTNLRNSLQLVQGKTVGAEDEANMPSLSKAEVASIMAGRVKNWNQFKAGPAGQGLRDYVVALGGTAPSSNLVNICRRVNGSGTQAQMNAKFLNYPCNPGSVAPTETSNVFNGPVVTLGSGSGDMDTCLATAVGLNKWAVGIQSTEKNTDNALNYRFVKIDGITPSTNKAATGKYFDWVELTYQWRVAGALPLTGDKLNLMNTIATNAASTDIVRDVMNIGGYTWGSGGYLALAANGNAVTFTPATYSQLNTYYDDTNSAIALGIAVSGSYAYVAGGTDGLRVFDISNPNSPNLVGSIDYPSSVPFSNTYAKDVVVSGNYAYVADIQNGLQVISISNPAVPSPAGSFKTAGTVFGVAVNGNHAYVAHSNGLTVVNISNPAVPSLVSSLTNTNLGTMGGVAVSGNYAYVAGGQSLLVIDISNPVTPNLVGTFNVVGNTEDIAVSANYAYIVGDGGLQVIDISNPTAPSLVSSLNGGSEDVVVSANQAYVVSGYYLGLQVIDIRNPAAPSLAGSSGTTGNGSEGNDFGVAVSGNYTYVANDVWGLRVIDISNPVIPPIMPYTHTYGGSTDNCRSPVVAGTIVGM